MSTVRGAIVASTSAAMPTYGLDGVYLGAGDRETTAILCVVGAREDGTKELVGMELDYRESTETRAGVQRGLRGRGMDAPLLAIGAVWQSTIAVRHQSKI